MGLVPLGLVLSRTSEHPQANSPWWTWVWHESIHPEGTVAQPPSAVQDGSRPGGCDGAQKKQPLAIAKGCGKYPQGDSNPPRMKAPQTAVKQGLYTNHRPAAATAALRNALHPGRKPPQPPPMTAPAMSRKRGALCACLRGLSRPGLESASGRSVERAATWTPCGYHGGGMDAAAEPEGYDHERRHRQTDGG